MRIYKGRSSNVINAKCILLYFTVYLVFTLTQGVLNKNMLQNPNYKKTF